MQFLLEEPQLTHPHEQMCLDMARFEWAQVVAFDGESKPALQWMTCWAQARQDFAWRCSLT